MARKTDGTFCVIPLEERFWKQVNKTEVCWLWTGKLLPAGYGRMSRTGRGNGDIRAHVYSWELHRGSIPDGQFVLHTCDVRHCVNPAHLFLGTNADNSADMVSKGRQAKGERHGSAKLKANDVREIRKRYAKGGITQVDLGKMFGVCQATVKEIIRREIWRDI